MRRGSEWQLIGTAPMDTVVDTKVDDGDGVRNQQPLKRIGALWWTPDGKMYVYYRPTHWRPWTDKPA